MQLNAALPILTNLCDITDGKTGLVLIREMFANATKWKMNTVRIYAHTTDPSHPFMVSACLLALLMHAHCMHHGCPLDIPPMLGQDLQWAPPDRPTL